MSLHAEDGAKFSPSAYLGFLYDTNMFRLPDKAAAQDRLGTSDMSALALQYGAGLDIGLPLSQQFLEVNLNAIQNHFDTMDYLDYTEILASTRWLWRYGPVWTGDLGLRYRQDIAPFEEFQLPAKDTRHQYTAFGNITRKLTPRWDLGLSAAHDDIQRNLAERQFLDRVVDRGFVDLVYRGARDPDTYVGFRASSRWIQFPNREVVATTRIDNSYQEQEYSMNLNWVASDKSTVGGQIGYSILHHDQFTDRDFSGPVGSVSYRYQATDSGGLELSAWQDIIVRTETAASYMTEVGASLKPYWRYSYRILFETNFSVVERRFKGDPLLSLTNQPTRRDTVGAAELSTTYTPYESIELRLVLHTELRDSNRNDKDYDYSSVAGNIRISF